jgi:hypothetical protein
MRSTFEWPPANAVVPNDKATAVTTADLTINFRLNISVFLPRVVPSLSFKTWAEGTPAGLGLLALIS